MTLNSNAKSRYVRRIQHASFAILLVCGVSSCSDTYGSSRDAGLAGMRYFKAIAIESPDPNTPLSNSDLNNLLLGVPPIPVFRIFRSRMQAYTAAMASDALIGDTVQFIYPIMLADVPKGCVVVDKRGTDYKIVAVGGRTYIAPVLNSIQSAMLVSGLPRQRMMLIRIPSVNVDLIGWRRGADLNVRVVSPQNSLIPDSGAAVVFPRLATLAATPDTMAR